MSHAAPPALTYPEAIVVGAIQGVSELFPVSSLGHNVLIPALVGGRWATDLSVAKPESPYLAFIVGLHVATALALLAYFWRDWIRIIGGFLTSIRDRQVTTTDQRLAWMIIIATIPVGIVGLFAEHTFRVLFGKAIIAAYFLIANGIILYAGERFRPQSSRLADEQIQAGRSDAQQWQAARERELATVPPRQRGGGRHAGGHQAERQREVSQALAADARLSKIGYVQGLVIGSTQILALLAGISRDGVAMVGGMFRGLSRQDAARFSFLLSAPVILAAGVLKVPDLMGTLGNGIRSQILVGSILSFIGAYLAVRFLMKYVQTRTLTPFAIYCVAFGLGSVIYLNVR
ncbi:MAG TPA: undecaprenyl-diphosphate phosphatase [Streptosporangiaceae bacterium]|nr:undecaprenyl-diphosphate phosphatase [Streptosporangiaceae bacterium]